MSVDRMNVYVDRFTSSRLAREGSMTPQTASTTIKVEPRRSESNVLTLEHLEVLITMAKERGAPMNTPVQVAFGEMYSVEPRQIQARFLDPTGEVKTGE